MLALKSAMRLMMLLLPLNSTAHASDASRISAYHGPATDSQYMQDKKWVKFVSESVDYWSAKTHTPYRRVIKTFMIVESGYDPNAISPERCKGIGQINPADEDFFAKRLRQAYNGPLPLTTTASYQIALSVIAFKVKLKDADGDLWDAVRRYNGAGPHAERYRDYVRRLYIKIFKSPPVRPHRKRSARRSSQDRKETNALPNSNAVSSVDFAVG